MLALDADQVLQVRPFLSVTAGVVVLFVGKLLNSRLPVLREYNIPEPVTGGLLFSVAFGVFYFFSGIKVDFDLTARDILLVYFFTVIGINAHFGDLALGGKPLGVLLVVTVVFMLAENLAGVGVAGLLGLQPSVGLLAGSISMTGGHGTAIAWAPVIAEAGGLANAMEIGLVCATMGLILASFTGGPVARFLIRHYKLKASAEQLYDVGTDINAQHPQIDYFSFLGAILAIHVAGTIGVIVHGGLESLGVKMPLFLPCLAAGILLTNLLPRALPADLWPSRTAALALIAEVSLGVFLAMSLMSTKLWTLAELAGPLSALLTLQLVLAMLFAVVCFWLLGRNYDAAVVSAGFIGFGLGATPTAMANMTAVTQRYGPSHVAFLIVPLVGAFFIDVANAVVIRMFLGAMSP
ncbi:sodium/glutamate symporter [Bradyrhizobium australiense]|uniref:Sodium/glutamate symporter n=1 Tax=Bradyrhizobium australiense TaxID=2721161 RepID=A0A7Y4GNV5_9BRAD|nr:sodium/glutamate symporter [Bradyrhizobium australiense]NOJ39116.1 sodium/glutamate symporter [Bradyrhizobium australiense]